MNNPEKEFALQTMHIISPKTKCRSFFLITFFSLTHDRWFCIWRFFKQVFFFFVFFLAAVFDDMVIEKAGLDKLNAIGFIP